jgi:hypothetical protein
MLIAERTRTTNVLEFLEDPAISGLIRTPSKCCTNRLDRLTQKQALNMHHPLLQQSAAATRTVPEKTRPKIRLSFETAV